MSWTDERVETLRRMWAEGASASQIAKELGGVTRNAVIGKVHRLGLSNRAGPGGRAGEAPGAGPAQRAEARGGVSGKAVSGRARRRGRANRGGRGGRGDGAPGAAEAA